MPGSFMVVHRAAIISLAARNNVPAVYFLSIFSKDGGLLSYGVDNRDVYRRAARYVDSILRGAKPSDLPVQPPSKLCEISRAPVRQRRKTSQGKRVVAPLSLPKTPFAGVAAMT